MVGEILCDQLEWVDLVESSDSMIMEADEGLLFVTHSIHRTNCYIIAPQNQNY